MARTKKSETQQRQIFLTALSETASISLACERSQLPRRTVYNWRKADPHFAAEWEAALELGTDALEDEAVRRAFHGNDKPVTFQGKVTDTFKEYSDILLMFMLKARRPDKFKDRSENKTSIEHSASEALKDLLQRVVASKPALPVGSARLAQRISVGHDPVPCLEPVCEAPEEG